MHVQQWLQQHFDMEQCVSNLLWYLLIGVMPIWCQRRPVLYLLCRLLWNFVMEQCVSVIQRHMFIGVMSYQCGRGTIMYVQQWLQWYLDLE